MHPLLASTWVTVAQATGMTAAGMTVTEIATVTIAAVTETGTVIVTTMAATRTGATAVALLPGAAVIRLTTSAAGLTRAAPHPGVPARLVAPTAGTTMPQLLRPLLRMAADGEQYTSSCLVDASQCRPGMVWLLCMFSFRFVFCSSFHVPIVLLFRGHFLLSSNCFFYFAIALSRTRALGHQGVASTSASSREQNAEEGQSKVT